MFKESQLIDAQRVATHTIKKRINAGIVSAINALKAKRYRVPVLQSRWNLPYDFANSLKELW